MTTNFEAESQNQNVPYPNVPPLIDSRETEYRGTGVTSSVAIFGHPIHPIIVIFPIAFLSGAAGSDLGYWLSHDPFWARASVWLLGLGILSGLAAAAIGMVDFIRIPKVRDRNAGWLHMVLNVAALLLSTINFFLRLGSPVAAILPFGLMISAVVATLLLVSGWYGGELTFRHKVGIIGPGETQA
jgi:uncharacterized membrane protein